MKKSGFTLAEVLITMGIIGIIAAITMPTLMMDTKYKQIGVKLSKFYSTLYNTSKEYTAYNGDYGSVDDFVNHINKSFDFKDINIYNESGKTILGTTGVDCYRQNNISTHYGLLADNTKVSILSGPAKNISMTLPDKYSNSRKYGSPLTIVYFDPMVKGLPSNAQHVYQFIVTTKGNVIPYDSCSEAAFANNWIVDSDWFEKDKVCYHSSSSNSSSNINNNNNNENYDS